MKFNTQAEAFTEARKYLNWLGVIYEGKQLPVRDIFVGTVDKGMSQYIYRGDRNDFKYTANDLANIEFWVVFEDYDMVSVSEVFTNQRMRKLCEPNALRHSIIVNENWSEPLEIPKGLHVRVIFKGEGDLDVRIKDETKTIERSFNRRAEEMFNLFYNDPNSLGADLVNPTISFKIQKQNESLEILLLFAPRLDYYTR